MGKVVSDVIEISSLGAIKDPLGIEAGEAAAKGAAAAQVAGTEAGIAEQRRQFDITQSGIKPFQEAGISALEQQRALLGIGGTEGREVQQRRPSPGFLGRREPLPSDTPSVTAAEAQQAAFDALEVSPGQKFLRDRAQRNLLRNASAIGGLGGGNVRSALVQQGVGFAQQDLQNQFGRLGQLAGQGQAAATNIGQFGAQTAGNIANLQQAGGAARASGILGANQANVQGTNQVFGLAGLGLGLL